MTEQKELAENQHDTTEAVADEQQQGMFTEAELNELAFLDAQNQPDYDPEQAEAADVEAKEAEKKAAEEKALANEMAAYMAINSFEGLIQSMSHSRFKLDEQTKQTAIERYKPLIAKYGPSAVGLFGQYQAEIMAGLFTVTLVKGSLAQIKELKAEDAERARQQKAAAAANDANKEAA